MPLYGQSFSLADASEHGLNAKSYGPGEAGEFTRAGGFLAFYEVFIISGFNVYSFKVTYKAISFNFLIIKYKKF